MELRCQGSRSPPFVTYTSIERTIIERTIIERTIIERTMRQHFLVAALAASLSALMSTGCSNTKPPSQDFDKLVNDFVYGSLALSPVGATSSGYHQHNGISLDEALDDWSPAGIEAARKFNV